MKPLLRGSSCSALHCSFFLPNSSSSVILAIDYPRRAALLFRGLRAHQSSCRPRKTRRPRDRSASRSGHRRDEPPQVRILYGVSADWSEPARDNHFVFGESTAVQSQPFLTFRSLRPRIRLYFSPICRAEVPTIPNAYSEADRAHEKQPRLRHE